jgi:uncharacterized repeat protein (TIGR01451 family)
VEKNMQKRLTFLTFTLVLVLAAMGAAAAADQPDLQIANDTSAPVGNNVYNTDASSQSITQDVNNYNPTVYDLTLQNDGDATDNILVQGTATSDGWTIQYFDDLNNDITSQVTGPGWVVSLTPGAIQNFRAQISAGPGVAIGATKDILVTATSGNDNTKQDVVKATTRYTAGLHDPNIGGIILDGNDDNYVGPITLPFTFNFYGTNYNTIYINNNGHVDFGNNLWMIYPPIPYPVYAFVTPFYGDIDTRPAASGKVHYDATSQRVVITWDRVGYWPSGTSSLNTFQVILTSDGLIGYSYGDMQWGTPRFGFNQGDGAQYVLQYPGDVDYQTYWFSNFGQPSNPELGITKYPDRNPANYNVGEDVVFTIYTQNVGTGTANNVVVTDTIPAGFSVVDAAGGTVDGNTITWNIGNLLAGGDNTIQLTLRVLDGYQGQTLTNSVSAGCYQTGIVTNTSSIYVNRAALEIFKTTDRNPATYNVGENVVYTITVDNEGPDAATNVVITDTLPEGLTFVSATNGGIWDANTRTITWNIGNMDNVEQFTATVTASVTGEAAAKTLENTATVDADQLSNPLTATASIYVPSADLVLTKTVDKATPTVKDTVVFTLIVNNNGPDTAVNVTVNDKLPAGLTYVSHVANFGTYDPNSGLWTISSLPNGASAVLTITAVVEESGQIVNQANVTALTWDPNLEGNTVSAAMDVQAEPVPVHGKTVDMEKTGAPIGALLVAFFMLLAGMVLPKRK